MPQSLPLLSRISTVFSMLASMLPPMSGEQTIDGSTGPLRRGPALPIPRSPPRAGADENGRLVGQGLDRFTAGQRLRRGVRARPHHRLEVGGCEDGLQIGVGLPDMKVVAPEHARSDLIVRCI